MPMRPSPAPYTCDQLTRQNRSGLTHALVAQPRTVRVVSNVVRAHARGWGACTTTASGSATYPARRLMVLGPRGASTIAGFAVASKRAVAMMAVVARLGLRRGVIDLTT